MPTPGTDLPRVVLVGRPNAGKSTLFNRLLQRRKALVDPTPGVTRDSNQAVVCWDDRAVLLVDTGGFETDRVAGLDQAVRARSLAAVAEAALVIYVLDGKAGLTAADEAAARELRRRAANVLFVVNKLESPSRRAAAAEFYRLGADDLIEVSAEHGHGVAALVEAILARVPSAAVETAAADAVRVCVIGRPNVGKSSLVNRLLGYPRSLVDPTAGTTRDSVDTALEVGGHRYILVDTAGIRRRARIDERLERFAAGLAIETLSRSDVALVVIDAVEGATDQDMRLATLVWEQGRGLVLLANKWDLQQGEPKRFIDELRRRYPSALGVPVLTVSAHTGSGVDDILPAVRRVMTAHTAELRTARLNDVVAAAVAAQAPPLVRGRRPKVYYATQTGRRPPEIVVFASAPESIHPSYQRYLQKRIAEAFRLIGTPVRVRFRARH